MQIKEIQYKKEKKEDEEEDTCNSDKERNEFKRKQRQRKCPEKLKNYVLLTYHEAMTGPDRTKWEDVIDEEKDSLKKNDMWEIVDMKDLKSEKPLHRKWIFRIK